MRIVLHEAAHTGEPSESAGRFIAMDDTKLSHADRQLSVAAVARVEDEAMSWAVHGLESPLLLFHAEGEHDIFVILPMTRGLP